MKIMLAAKAVALAMAACTGAAHPVIAQQLTPVTLTTGWIFSGGTTAALLLAEKRGYFTEGGVKINIVRGFGSADVVAKVATKTYEAGTGYLPALVRTRAENPELDAIAVVISYDASPDAVTGIKGKGISSPRDLAASASALSPIRRCCSLSSRSRARSELTLPRSSGSRSHPPFLRQ